MTKHIANSATVTVGGQPFELRPYQQAAIDHLSGWRPGSYEQAIGRITRGRLVHARRARKLRRLGHSVRYAGRTSTGRAMYRWSKKAITVEIAAGMGKTFTATKAS